MLANRGWLLWLCLLTSLARADWYPLAVRADGELVQYSPLAQASQPWRICALLPHGKDRYWWGVAWGLDGEARRQGVQLGIYEAGGYENGAQQMKAASWPRRAIRRCCRRASPWTWRCGLWKASHIRAMSVR